MENFIKEYKLDVGAQHLSHSSFAANQAKVMLLAIAYNLINACDYIITIADGPLALLFWQGGLF